MVDFEEFKVWWAIFSVTHGAHVLQKQVGGMESPDKQAPPSLDEIEFKVWMSRHSLEDFHRTFKAEGHLAFPSLQDLGGHSCARLLWSMGMTMEDAMPLLTVLDARRGAVGGLGDDFMNAAKSWGTFADEVEMTEEQKATQRKDKERQARKVRRRARHQASQSVPHYMQPHLAAMLPEFVNQGAERGAGVWGVAGAGTGTATTLQDHKWNRHKNKNEKGTHHPGDSECASNPRHNLVATGMSLTNCLWAQGPCRCRT